MSIDNNAISMEHHGGLSVEYVLRLSRYTKGTALLVEMGQEYTMKLPGPA